MANFFNHFPIIDYDLNKDSVTRVIQNPLVRFKIKDLLKERAVLYYDHYVEEGQTAQEISYRYYENVKYDWVIHIVNDIFDPSFDWPMDYQSFIAYIKAKYGSVSAAKAIHKHYEWVYQQQARLADGTIIPERYHVVDREKYDTLAPSDRRSIDMMQYEDRLNTNKRTIKILRKEYVSVVVNSVGNIL